MARWKQSRVDWKGFAEEVDHILKENDPYQILAVRVANFLAALILVGERVVGKKKPKRKNRVWMNAHIRAIIRKSNKLHKNIYAKRGGGKAACQEVTHAMSEAKTSSWNKILASPLPDQALPRSGPLSGC